MLRNLYLWMRYGVKPPVLPPHAPYTKCLKCEQLIPWSWEQMHRVQCGLTRRVRAAEDVA